MSERLFEVERDALLAAVINVSKVVQKKKTIPILSHLHLEIDVGLVVTGTDLDIQAKAEVGIITAYAMTAFCLPADIIARALRSFSKGAAIAFERNDNSHITITDSEARIEVLYLPGDDFPQLSASEMPCHFSMSEKSLHRLFDAVAYTMSDEEARYYLNGIHLHTTGEEQVESVVSVATNGRQLARLVIDPPEIEGDMPPIIIPRRTVGLLLGLLRADASDDQVTIDLSARVIRFQLPAGLEIQSKLIDGTFPDYTRVIPENNDNRFTFDPKTAINACKKAMVVATEKTRCVRMDWADEVTTFGVTDRSAGLSHAPLPVERLNGETLTIGVNGQYWQETLAVLPGRSVAMMADPGSPIRIEPIDNADGEAFTGIIMPIRL